MAELGLIPEYVYFCEFHDVYAKGEDHRYCEERGFVSRWERVESEGPHPADQEGR